MPERLDAAMRRARINQSQLAEAVGVKQPSIGRLLSGETKTSRAIVDIAAQLNTTPAYLRGETDEPGVEFSGAAELSAEEQELLQLLRRLDGGHRAALLQLARSLAGEGPTLHEPRRGFRTG